MKKYIGISIIALSMGLASCNDYLDKLPDDRAEIDTEKKVAQLWYPPIPNVLLTTSWNLPLTMCRTMVPSSRHRTTISIHL